MSPLLFLAIAVVVPLVGMMALGIGARISSQRVTDDETEPFRRRLESIAPRDPRDAAARTPGLRGAARRLRGGRVGRQAPSRAPDASGGAAAPVAGSIRLVERKHVLPPLPPLSADLYEPPQPPAQPGSRRAPPRPPAAARRHDRVISPGQRRRPGS